MILEMWKRMQRKQEEMEEGRGMAHNQERKEVRANVGYCSFFLLRYIVYHLFWGDKQA
jgi:hypothetical protein